MKHTKRIAALASIAGVAGVTLASLAWPTSSGAQATNAIDQPSTWFVTCYNPSGHEILGGRLLTNGYGAEVELVGPVAITLAGAVDFARQADLVFADGGCEPTHLHEVWMISNAREVGIGEAAELSFADVISADRIDEQQLRYYEEWTATSR